MEVGPLPRSIVAGRAESADFFPGMSKKWGLGFLLNTEAAPGRRAAGSLAWGGLYNTYYWIDPASGVTGAIFAQLLPFADGPVLEAFEGFEREVYAAL